MAIAGMAATEAASDRAKRVLAKAKTRKIQVEGGESAIGNAKPHGCATAIGNVSRATLEAIKRAGADKARAQAKQANGEPRGE